MIENIDDVNSGVYKRWIYSNKVDYELVCDYLQKINYSIQDYNHLISQKLSRGDVCYLILLVTWIQESYKQLVDDVEDREFLRKLLEAMYEELPAPKKKK